MSPEIEIVGCSPRMPDGVCLLCDGDGDLGDPNYGEKVILCPECDGTGGDDPSAVELARRFNNIYREALLGDDS